MNITTRARRLQEQTGLSYQASLQKLRDIGARSSKLAESLDCTIEQSDLYLVQLMSDQPLPPMRSATENLNTKVVTGEEVEGETEVIETGDRLVPANESASLMVISEKGPFILDNLVMSVEAARNFMITDIKVGRNSQFVSAAAVPAYFFARRGANEDLCFDKLPRGMMITLSVTNLSDDHTTFSCSLRGKVVGDSQFGPRKDRTVLGLGAMVIRPGRFKITVQPQVVFKPDCLVIDPELLTHFQVTALRVLGIDVLPKETTSSEMVFSSKTTQMGDWITVEVVNFSSVPKLFHAAIGGNIVRIVR